MNAHTPARRTEGTKRVAADVGGTFTDVAVLDETTGELSFGKTLSTHPDLIRGMEAGVAETGSRFSETSLFLHGTTVVINTLLERSGAKTALVTTRGFRDVYEIGRINRPNAYDLFFRKHRPLVDRDLRFEVTERLDSSGKVLAKLDFDALERVAASLIEKKIESVAILFLHSYTNPMHELAAKQFLEERCPGIFVTASHELSREYREFERTSTAVANAYVGPQVRGYLDGVEKRLDAVDFKGSLLIVQSTGGLYDPDQARSECIRMLESGPAAGVIGTRALCSMMGLDNAIAFDMGGTTAKAGVIVDGSPLMAGRVIVGGYAEGLPVQVPMIDIEEVGTGGGSIARIGPSRALRVGPESAGANPGPVCYAGGGTEPTVTDANLVLGRLSATNFLGGQMMLDEPGAREALRARIAEPSGLSLEEAADGILQIAVTSMANVVRRATTERGLDASGFAMVAYGGAGPLHAALVARELQVSQVIIPRAPGHFSAFGMLNGDVRRDYVRTLFVKLGDAPFDRFDEMFAEMERTGMEEVRGTSGNLLDIQVLRGADMRYVGQEHAVSVDIPSEHFANRDAEAILAEFHAVHERRYGYSSTREDAEVVSLRCSVVGVMEKPSVEIAQVADSLPPVAGSVRPVYFSDTGWHETPVFDRRRLAFGNEIPGPALIEEHASTTVVPKGSVVRVDQIGNLCITIGN